MDVEKANYVLGKAIARFQDGEIEDLSGVFDGVADHDLEVPDEDTLNCNCDTETA